MESIEIAVLMVTTLFSVISFLLALNSYIEVQSFKKSTHSVQYVGAKPQDLGVSNDLSEEVTSDQLNKINKQYSEELEKEMPWFAPSDEDKKLRSL